MDYTKIREDGHEEDQDRDGNKIAGQFLKMSH
jgi:hypothetical protein